MIRHLFFDWGNTLMPVFPEYESAMCTWPQVFAMPDAREVLAVLNQNYVCRIATNAGDSQAAQVREALARVDLAEFIANIFTSREIGLNKTNPRFYDNLAKMVNADPADLIMIGDDYMQDVQSAYQAGWKTVWFNEKREACPAIHPMQDGEINHLLYLPEVLVLGFWPGLDQCQAWMDKYELPENICAHSRAVASYAYRLAVHLRYQGMNIDPLLIHRAALLHDLDKLQTDRAQAHGSLAAKIMLSKGFPEIASIVQAM